MLPPVALPLRHTSAASAWALSGGAPVAKVKHPTHSLQPTMAYLAQHPRRLLDGVSLRVRRPTGRKQVQMLLEDLYRRGLEGDR